MAKRRHINYATAQARRKNEEDRIYREKAKARKAFWDKNGRLITITAAAVIVALILLKLAGSFFFGPGGSLPQFAGKLRNVGENWIVTDLSNTAPKKYFKLGEMQAPEGYTYNEEMSVNASSLNQNFYYNADDETAMIADIYVSGVANYGAQAQLERLIDYGYFKETSGAKKASIGGKDVDYAYFVFDISGEHQAEEGTVTYASICAYVDTVKDSCILMMLNSSRDVLENIPNEEAMLAELEHFLPLMKAE